MGRAERIGEFGDRFREVIKQRFIHHRNEGSRVSQGFQESHPFRDRLSHDSEPGIGDLRDLILAGTALALVLKNSVNPYSWF